MKQMQPRDNSLGPGGWLWGGRYGMERYLYLLHRVTGLGLILFVIFHLIVTTIFRIQGMTVWESVMALLSNPFTAAGEILVVIAFVFHTLNGARLILQELGFALGKPTPPIYPYRDALRKRRGWTVALIVIIIIISLVFIIEAIAGG